MIPPFDRQLKGIVTIYQEFNLLPNMTIAENFFLGREPTHGLFINEKIMNEEAQMVLDNLGLNIKSDTQVARLSIAQQQMVEIARAMTLNTKLIIMDELSAALSDKEVETLHKIVRDLKKRGVSVIYITHRLNEVFALCDRFTVFQDECYVGEGNVSDTSVDNIIKMMVGREVAFTRRPSEETHHADKPIVLTVKNLTREKPILDPHGIALHDISFSIHQGEILGIAGLVGTGRTEIARCLFGLEKYTADVLTLNGKPYQATSPLDALEKGIALVPEELLMNQPGELI
ncbi:ATP-binding cassette domain-containing protein [Rodentibacter myodis]|uniref:ATP-binding cassette domain-containing protein n=1 Tax=Rodentibacter myodis TaxID=1907939 RepID=UPI00244C99E2|nr:ATP-binding cassette domain-containing protein [Rodentibacter myodis]